MTRNSVNFSCSSSTLLKSSHSSRDTSLSLLPREEVVANRILSRISEDSRGFSCRVYYLQGGAGQVPFEWEARPGQPKVVVPEDCSPVLPPLSPPPAVLSSILAKERPSLLSKPAGSKNIRFWKKSRKAHNYNAPQTDHHLHHQKSRTEYDHVEESSDSSVIFWMSDGDSFSSPRVSSSSSSSSPSCSSYASSFTSGCPSPVRKFPGMNFPLPAQLRKMIGQTEKSKRRWAVERLDRVLACTPWRPIGVDLAARDQKSGCAM